MTVSVSHCFNFDQLTGNSTDTLICTSKSVYSIVGSTTACVGKKKESCIKPFVAPEEAVKNQTNCLKWCHLSRHQIGLKSAGLEIRI